MSQLYLHIRFSTALCPQLDTCSQWMMFQGNNQTPTVFTKRRSGFKFLKKCLLNTSYYQPQIWWFKLDSADLHETTNWLTGKKCFSQRPAPQLDSLAAQLGSRVGFVSSEEGEGRKRRSVSSSKIHKIQTRTYVLEQDLHCKQGASVWPEKLGNEIEICAALK